MSPSYDTADEQALIASYCVGVKPGYVHVVRHHLRSLCRTFRERHTDSVLHHTTTTRWVAAWQRHCGHSPTTQEMQLGSLRRWWGWLFEREIVGANVLAFVCLRALVRGHEPVLVLPTDLHRLISVYERTLTCFSAKTREGHRLALKDYVRFVSGQAAPRAGTLEEAFSAERLQQWIGALMQRLSRAAAIQYAYNLERFTGHLVEQGRLAGNPLQDAVRRYPLRGRSGVVDALAGPDPPSALKRLAKAPRFQSGLAGRFWSFLEWKRAMGRKYAGAEIALADFDRFLIGEGIHTAPLTQAHLDRYVAGCSRLGPATLAKRLGLVRHFCAYLRRFEPDSVMPGPQWGRVHIPRFHPFVLSPDQFQRIVAATHVCFRAPRWPLRAESFRTLLRLLYATGLRPGEALRLTVEDVDLAGGVLTVRETKFYKSRLVPIAASLTQALRRYAGQRDELLEPGDPQAAFLRTSRRTAYCLHTMDRTFRDVVHQAGLDAVPRRRPPRLHDLRHSFAVRRLLEWYREGADVQSKLPLLSTYLGHANVAATQVYLTVTVELLEEANRRFEAYAGTLVTTQTEEGRDDESR